MVGVAINLSLGENGIFSKAKQARNEYINAESYEEESLNILVDQLWGEKKKIEEITLNKTNITLYVGETETLVTTILPDDATNKNVKWSSRDTSIATVENGTVTAIAPGTAIITATTQDGNGKSASCVVTVENKVYLIKDGDFEEYGWAANGGDVTTSKVETGENKEISFGNGYLVYSNVITNLIDVTNYTKLCCYAKLTNTTGETESINRTAGHIILTKSKTYYDTNWSSENYETVYNTNQILKMFKADESDDDYYEIDLSSTTGEWYIGFIFSNRFVHCYNMWLEK